MKIWFAANIPENSYGGVGRSMKELAEGLRQRGHDVTVAYSTQRTTNNYILYSILLAVRLCATGASRRPDWIIARSSDGVVCSLLCRLFRLKTKTMLHNHGWEEHVLEHEQRLPRALVTSPTTWKAHLVRFPLLRLALHLCDRCISGTLCEIRWLKKRYPSQAGRLFCVPNGITPRPSPFWTGGAEIPFAFLCVGGLTWKKNLQHSVSVFQAIRRREPDARLYCVGTGEVKSEQVFPAGKRGSTEGMSIVPYSSWGEMDAWYRRCPFLISSSRFEGGHSLAVLEAMSYGLCVCVSPIRSTLEFVSDGRTGIVISGTDPEADAERIMRCIGNRELNESIRLQAFRAAARHAWQRQARRLEAILCRHA
jgi:glycosyltransferase involved in cell wall biosynthesis